MKTCLILAAVLFVPTFSDAQTANSNTPTANSNAQTAKPCEELKSEIAAKLDAKGVKSYSLDIVAKDQDAEGKAVGTCEGGTKKIVYRRGAAATTQSAAKEPAKP